ncbi:MAG: hypothetical protein LBK53_09705 [Heliobacteriaceae bacterium]|jgi:hypothetical protein|nr:hypothetical protein [Heliobacteriaceae bacterium]
MSRINAITDAVIKPVKWVSERPFVKNKLCGGFQKQNMAAPYEKNLGNTVMKVGLASIVLKDGLGCVMYVKQSLNNKEIPEDKRKFVAALDLTNGALMIIFQILTALTISNAVVQKRMLNKLFGKYLSRDAAKTYKAAIKETTTKKLTGEAFHEGFDDVRRDLLGVFDSVVTLVASTIIGKRVLVPLVATPLADKVKDWMNRNDKPAEVDAKTKNTYDTETPSAIVKSQNLVEKYKAENNITV